MVEFDEFVELMEKLIFGSGIGAVKVAVDGFMRES